MRDSPSPTSTSTDRPRTRSRRPSFAVADGVQLLRYFIINAAPSYPSRRSPTSTRMALRLRRRCSRRSYVSCLDARVEPARSVCFARAGRRYRAGTCSRQSGYGGRAEEAYLKGRAGAATLVLVACGLLASGIAVTTIVRYNRVDQTLLDAAPAGRGCPRITTPPVEGPNPARPPSNFACAASTGPPWTAPPNPCCPQQRRRAYGHRRLDGSEVKWRAISRPRLRGELTTVAIDLPTYRSTVRALRVLPAQIGSAVLFVLGVVGYWVVHRSPAPLDEVERTGCRDRLRTARPPCPNVMRALKSADFVGAQRNAQNPGGVASSESSAEAARCAASSPTPATSCTRR